MDRYSIVTDFDKTALHRVLRRVLLDMPFPRLFLFHVDAMELARAQLAPFIGFRLATWNPPAHPTRKVNPLEQLQQSCLGNLDLTDPANDIHAAVPLLTLEAQDQQAGDRGTPLLRTGWRSQWNGEKKIALPVFPPDAYLGLSGGVTNEVCGYCMRWPYRQVGRCALGDWVCHSLGESLLAAGHAVPIERDKRMPGVWEEQDQQVSDPGVETPSTLLEWARDL